MRLLQSARLIRYRRGHIQILDRPALRVTCECYAVVRHNLDKLFPSVQLHVRTLVLAD